MDYDKAEQIRKKSFGSLLGEQEGGLGASLKSAISQKTQAKVTGIKEKFDPMNIARAVGGKTGAAAYGKVFGRDQKSMERFAGVRKKRVSAVDDIGKASDDSSPADVLGLIYRMMLRNAEDDKLQNELKQNKKEEEDKEEEDRNQQLIRALTGRKKPPTKKEKAKEKKPEGEKPTEPAPTVPKGKGKGKAPEKPVTKESPKAPTSKEVTKPPAQKPLTEKVPTPPAQKPLTEKVPTPPAPRAPVKASKGVAGQVAANAGVIAGITSGLVAAGITNSYAQTAIMANVGKESRFKLEPEDMYYTTVDRLKKVFPSKFGKMSDEEASQYLKNPEKLGNFMYGGQYGNTEPGDGFKYRGRGSIGLTFRGQYESTAKEIGVPELATNPDLANDPEVNRKIVANYMVKNVGLKKLNEFTDQQTANRVITQAVGGKRLNLDKGIGAEILSKVDEYSAALGGNVATGSGENVATGSKIDQASKENKELKKPTDDRSAPTVINNNTNTQQNSTNKPKLQKEDDRSAYQKKTQG